MKGGIDDFMVGCVWRYYQISSPADAGWDAAIERADTVYRERMHDICCDNCHHHTALALEASGRPQWGCAGLLSAWLLCALYGKCTWCDCGAPPPPPSASRLVVRPRGDNVL